LSLKISQNYRRTLQYVIINTMEKNGREASEIVPHSIWIYLPTELWFQIFRYLRATRYIALIGVLSKGFREFVIEYFKTVSGWMNKNMNVAIIGVPDVGNTY
jgi:hypothetical protein